MFFLSLILSFFFLSVLPASAQEQSPTMNEVNQELEQSIQKFDVAVNVVNVVLNDEHRLGVDWGAIVSDFHTVALKKENDLAWSDKKYRLNIGSLSQDDYEVLLDALDTVGKVSQHPQAQATVNLGESQALAINDENVKLQLTVTKIQEDNIHILLEPFYHLSSYDSKVSGKPTKLDLIAKTEEKVGFANTIVLGGVFEEQEITKTHKFPLLGDLPLVGLVFRSQGRLMQKIEKIIFITITTSSSS